MTSRSSLKRTLIRRKPPRRLTRQVRDPDYLAWLHTQPCWLAAFGGCAGNVEADHGSGHGTGQRNPDAMALPVCVRHHREPGWTVIEPFLSWGKAERRRCVETQRLVMRTRWIVVIVQDSSPVPF